MERKKMGILNLFLFAGTRWLRFFFPTGWWKIRTQDKILYLTFDDGPIPEVTPFVLATLSKFQAKATFFVIGDNVRKFPEIANLILNEGHALGNHTDHHVSGFATSTAQYEQEVADCQARHPQMKAWFRPPYGRITFRQFWRLRKKYDIVFWDVLTQDYDPSLPPEACLQGSLRAIRPGSIVVFHDSWKAWPRLSFVLPHFLEEAAKQGYRFDLLPIPIKHSTNTLT
ncbi:MAG: polysaccharide deacetylase family protein [Spirosomataceae bacterium]